MSSAAFIDYDMYLYTAEEELDEIWKDPTPCDIWNFIDVLLEGMLKCDLVHRKYTGDSSMQPDSPYNDAQSKRSSEASDHIRKIERTYSDTEEYPCSYKFF